MLQGMLGLLDSSEDEFGVTVIEGPVPSQLYNAGSSPVGCHEIRAEIQIAREDDRTLPCSVNNDLFIIRISGTDV